jgi:hypothetical protein
VLLTNDLILLKASGEDFFDKVYASMAKFKDETDVINNTRTSALAWACISMIFQQAIKTAHLHSEILPDAVASIVGVIVRSYTREDLYREPQIEKFLVPLFSSIFVFLAACLRYLSSSSLSK